jgi:hypothetical protein
MYGGLVYMGNTFSSRGPNPVEVVCRHNTPPLQVSLQYTKMWSKKTVVFRPQRPSRPSKAPKQTAQLQGSSAQACEESEPLIFPFDEDLEREERQRRYIAPVHHLCTRPAQYLR